MFHSIIKDLLTHFQCNAIHVHCVGIVCWPIRSTWRKCIKWCCTLIWLSYSVCFLQNCGLCGVYVARYSLSHSETIKVNTKCLVLIVIGLMLTTTKSRLMAISIFNWYNVYVKKDVIIVVCVCRVCIIWLLILNESNLVVFCDGYGSDECHPGYCT